MKAKLIGAVIEALAFGVHALAVVGLLAIFTWFGLSKWPAVLLAVAVVFVAVELGTWLCQIDADGRSH